MTFGRSMHSLCLLAAFAASPVCAQMGQPLHDSGGEIPPASRAPILQSVGVDQKLGESIPLDLTLTQDNGQPVKLKDLLHGRPILLTPVYFQCPMLCSITLNQLLRSMNALTASAGKEFDVWTVSFDPKEDATLADKKKRTYLKAYRREGAEQGWSFLTGSDANVKQLMDSVGFRYQWDPVNNVYAHVAAVIVLTPQGKISRYFLGVDYPPVPLQVAMDQAKGGTVGEKAEQIYLYCFHYDPATGKYGLIISRALQVAGISMVIAMVGLIGGLQMIRHRHEASEVTRSSADDLTDVKE